MGTSKRATLYVDGFNLYNRSLKDNPHLKWLNLVELGRAMMPDGYSLTQVEYFTARIKPTGFGSAPLTRQQIYLRALQTLSPVLRMHFGHFSVRNTKLPVWPIEKGDDNRMRLVAVQKVEEKGSDVTLAARMVADLLSGRAEAAVLLSNDSDFVPTIRMLTEEFSFDFGILFPWQNERKPARELRGLSTSFTRVIQLNDLAIAQFPPELEDSYGTFYKPSCWT